jgi:putative addiction module component (TIGR02574 family)
VRAGALLCTSNEKTLRAFSASAVCPATWLIHFHAVQREDDRATNISGEAASCCCGSVSIDMLSVDPFPHGTRGARLNPMNARVDHLLDEVLGLPLEERSALAVALLDSLETADEATVSDLWRAEVNRRRAELRAGRVQAAPWTEVRQRLGSL